jgi:FkbM family methyltransferase
MKREKEIENKINYKIVIYNLILKIFCSLIPQKIFHYLESLSSQLQGKGIGSFSISEEVNACKKLLKNRNIKFIFDIGANKGDYTQELLNHYKEANYYLFEPSLLNYEKLNLRFLNQKNIKIVKQALSDKNGSDFLYSDQSGSGLGSLIKRKLNHLNINFDVKEKISLTRLDTFLKKLDKSIIIDYLKMDVEGTEINVLHGMGEFINRIKLIQFEFGGCNIDSRTFFQDFWYYFKDHNFDLFRITLTGSKKIYFYDDSDECFKTTNYIALNKNL